MPKPAVITTRCKWVSLDWASRCVSSGVGERGAVRLRAALAGLERLPIARVCVANVPEHATLARRHPLASSRVRAGAAQSWWRQNSSGGYLGLACFSKGGGASREGADAISSKRPRSNGDRSRANFYLKHGPDSGGGPDERRPLRRESSICSPVKRPDSQKGVSEALRSDAAATTKLNKQRRRIHISQASIWPTNACIERRRWVRSIILQSASA